MCDEMHIVTPPGKKPPITRDRVRRVPAVGEVLDATRLLAHSLWSFPWARRGDRAFLEALLPFVNRVTTPLERAVTYFCTEDISYSGRPEGLEELIAPRPAPVRRNVMQESKLLQRIDAWWEANADRRAFYRECFELICRDRPGAHRRFGDDINQCLARLLPVTKLTWDGKRIVRDEAILAVDHNAVLDYSLALLLDESKDLGQQLRKCRLEACGNFFLIPTGRSGGRKPLYCRPEHRLEAASASSPRRSAEYRDRQARKAK